MRLQWNFEPNALSGLVAVCVRGCLEEAADGLAEAWGDGSEEDEADEQGAEAELPERSAAYHVPLSTMTARRAPRSREVPPEMDARRGV